MTAFVAWTTHRTQFTFEKIDKEIGAIAMELPEVINDEVVWVSIIRDKTVIRAVYVIQDDNDTELTGYYVDIPVQDEFMQDCKDPVFTSFLSFGFSWESIYQSSGGTVLTRVSADARMCDEMVAGDG